MIVRIEYSKNAYVQNFQFSSDVDWNWCIFLKVYKKRIEMRVMLEVLQSRLKSV